MSERWVELGKEWELGYINEYDRIADEYLQMIYRANKKVVKKENMNPDAKRRKSGKTTNL